MKKHKKRNKKIDFNRNHFLKKHINFLENEDIVYEQDEILHLLKEVKKIFLHEETLIEIDSPCYVVGDLHGQYEDLHRIFVITGDKQKSGSLLRRFLFLGDYVDRGAKSLECICCLFIHKLAFPKMFHLLRGNHETAVINRTYGFYEELMRRFEEAEAIDLWKAFNDVFDCLPLAAIIRNKILCMHGGLSPLLTSINEIRKIKRPLSNAEDNKLACDLLWSDPMKNIPGFEKNNLRGVSVFFGEDSVNKICNTSKIELIIRGHQMMPNGFSFFCGRKLVTVFSAPNYDLEKNNKGAVIFIDKHLKIGFILLSPADAERTGKNYFLQSYDKWSVDSEYNQNVLTANEPPTVYGTK